MQAKAELSAEINGPAAQDSRHFQSAFQKTRKLMRLLPLDKLREIYFSENKSDVIKKRLKAYQKTILPSLKSGIANHETILLTDSPAAEVLNAAEYLAFIMLCEAKLFYLNSDREKTLSDILLVQAFMDTFSGIPTGASTYVTYQVHHALNCLILRMIHDSSNAKELEEMIVSLDKSKKTIEFGNLIVSEKSNMDQNIGNILAANIKKSPENRKFREKALKDLRSESFLSGLKDILGDMFLKAENIAFVSVSYSKKKRAFKTLKKHVSLAGQKLVQSSIAGSVYQKKYAPIVESSLQSVMRRLTDYYELSLIDITLNDLLTLSYLIKLHKLEHKTYPGKLSELTRSGFRIPRDRFSERPFYYKKLSKKEFLLWSAGPDEMDNNAEKYFSPDSGDGDIFLKPLI